MPGRAEARRLARALEVVDNPVAAGVVGAAGFVVVVPAGFVAEGFVVVPAGFLAEGFVVVPAGFLAEGFVVVPAGVVPAGFGVPAGFVVASAVAEGFAAGLVGALRAEGLRGAVTRFALTRFTRGGVAELAGAGDDPGGPVPCGSSPLRDGTCQG